MPVYQYKGISSSGRATSGSIEADSARAARIKLKATGIFPKSVEETRAQKSNKNAAWNMSIQLKGHKVSLSQLSIAARQFATLIGAGMPVVEAIRALCDQIDSDHLRQVFAEVGEKVNEGDTLANAMREHQKVFPRVYINMVASGEASGKLDLVLERLADLFESQTILRRKIYSALTYPILMLVLCFCVVVFLLIFLVPKITEIFKSKGALLPLPTRIVIYISDFLQNYWYYCSIVAVLAFFAIRTYAASTKGKRQIDKLKLAIPVFGSIILKTATSRFARNLGTMLNSGIELLRALGIARNIVSNVILEEAIDKAIDRIREGASLSTELKSANLFPPLLTHMVAIGEKTGALDEMLLRAAKSYESEVDAFVSGLTSIIEPLLIVFLAFIVGIIIIAVMLPMLEMASLTGM